MDCPSPEGEITVLEVAWEVHPAHGTPGARVLPDKSVVMNGANEKEGSIRL